MADDDSDDYLLFTSVLTEIDSSVKFTWCASGQKLFEFLEQSHDLPDMILLDLKMPVMDGLACLRKLKSTAGLNLIPVVLYSTTGFPGIVNDLAAHGAHLFIFKPASVSGYVALIHSLLALINRGPNNTEGVHA